MITHAYAYGRTLTRPYIYSAQWGRFPVITVTPRCRVVLVPQENRTLIV